MIRILRQIADHLGEFLHAEHSDPAAQERQDTAEAVRIAIEAAANSTSSPSIVRVPKPAFDFKLTAPLPKSGARWVPPGEPVIVKGVRIAGGMFYLGTSLSPLGGSGVEPALINPKLKIDDEVEAPGFGAGFYGFYVEYRTLPPLLRRAYLEWLAGDRAEIRTDFRIPSLYFYGLERRLVAPYVAEPRPSKFAETPLTADEEHTLRREVRRLADVLPDASLRRNALSLLQFLGLKDRLESGDDASLPDPNTIAAMPRGYQTLPALLSIALDRMATEKTPLTADWAWAWFLHDFESSLRTAVVRCPQEVRRLFVERFSSTYGRKGIVPRSTKATVSLSYSLANPLCYANARLRNGKSDQLIHEVSRTPLKGIRDIADASMDAIDAYTRRVGRDPERRNALPVVALLPNPLFQEHPEVVRFRAYLDAMLPPDAAATLPVADLLAHYQGDPASGPLSRSDTLAFLDAMDRMGFAVEPDLRYGGGAFAIGKDGTAVAAIARRGERAKTGSTNPALLAVGLPLLVRAARASGSADAAALPGLTALVFRLPRVGNYEPSRLAARLAWLLANPKESAKLPKPKESALADLADDERTRIADLLPEAASLSGAVGPAGVTELIRLFALLGLPDSEVFSRLHTSASGGHGKPGAEFAIPKPPSKAAKKSTGSGVTIDLSLVKQKEAESAQISSLLADIFTDDEPVAVAPSTPTTTAAPPPGGLDARHAALLRALVAKDSWTKAEVAALARAENLLPNAAVEAINEAAFERFDEPVLDGEDPIYVSTDLAKELL